MFEFIQRFNVNVIRIVCPEDDADWPEDATELMRNHILVPGATGWAGGLGYDSPYSVSADALSGPHGACYALAAVDTTENDPSIVEKFLNNYVESYAGIKVYEGTGGGGTGELDGTDITVSYEAISEGEFSDLDVRLFTELTRHPSGGDARDYPDGGKATEGDNGQKALGFCIMCRGDETSMPLNWLARTGMTSVDVGGPRIDCRSADLEFGEQDIDIYDDDFFDDDDDGDGVDDIEDDDIPDKIF